MGRSDTGKNGTLCFPFDRGIGAAVRGCSPATRGPWVSIYAVQHCWNALGPGPAAGGQWDGPHGETLYSRRVPCKTVLEVNDNSDRRIPDRLTFELKELRLKLYSFDSSTASSVSFLLIPPLSHSFSLSLLFLLLFLRYFCFSFRPPPFFLRSFRLPRLLFSLFLRSLPRKGVVRRWINDSYAPTDSTLPWRAF